MPCYRWRRAVLVQADHPLAQETPLTMEAIARYPLATYVFAFDRGAPLDEAFRKRGLSPDVHFTATDADIIKTYVRRGAGVGIVAALAHDPAVDTDLRCLDASHLFEVSTARLVFRRGTFFRRYMFEFLGLFAPHLTEEALRMALGLRGKTNLDPVFADTELPLY
jgi:LysR family cys regulon transcriptional activator